MDYFWIAVAAYFGWLAAPFILIFGIIALIILVWLFLLFIAKVDDIFRDITNWLLRIKRRVWK